MWEKVWNLAGPETVYSEVYTFAMAKIVFVQVHGTEKPLAIKADEAKEEMTNEGGEPLRLKLTLDGKPVGKFKASMVDGWWIEET